MRKILTLAIILLLVLSTFSILAPQVKAEDSNERTGQNLEGGGSATTEDLAVAILTPSTAPLLVSASKTGKDVQFEVYTIPLQGFPTDSPSWALISTGEASSIAGVATTFYSYNTGGPTSPPYSHRGYPSYDIATLRLTLSVPSGATTLSFDWKFGTEENPTWIGLYVDWARAIVTTSVGSANILLLPDGKPVDVDNAVPFSNKVTGSSEYPLPPYPSPNDVVYNAVTGMYKATFNVAPYIGETIRIDFQIADENDQILDSALFIDNLNIEVPIQQMVEPVEGYLSSKFGLRHRNCQQEFHNGIDITDIGILGREIVAPAGGIVIGTGDDKVWGYWLRVYHGEVIRRDDSVASGVSTGYCHLLEVPRRPTGELLKPGDVVKQGDVIGKVGMTGDATGPHLHFVVREGTKVVDSNLVALGKEVNPLNYVYYPPGPGVKQLDVRTKSPVDIILSDPDGHIISKDLIQIEMTATYLEDDFDRDGDLDDQISIIDPKTGDYLITVVPEPGALPTDTYTLEVSLLLSNGITVVLAENVQISNIPSQPYIVRLTETEIIPILPATIDFDPDTLNLKSIDQWVTVYIELPLGHGYDVSMINLGSLRLNGQVKAEAKPTEIGDYDGDGIPDLMVKFSRKAVQKILYVGDMVEVVISGKLTDGRLFEGKDTIKVILPP